MRAMRKTKTKNKFAYKTTCSAEGISTTSYCILSIDLPIDMCIWYACRRCIVLKVIFASSPAVLPPFIQRISACVYKKRPAICNRKHTYTGDYVSNETILKRVGKLLLKNYRITSCRARRSIVIKNKIIVRQDNE